MADGKSTASFSSVPVPKCGKCGTEKKRSPGGQWYCGSCANERAKARYQVLKAAAEAHGRKVGKRNDNYRELKLNDPEAYAVLKEKNRRDRAAWRARDGNRQKTKQYSKNVRARARMACLVAYSGPEPFCACCNENHVEFLSIDHIEGGGNKHRKQIKANGGYFYRWLRKKGFPSGFRVLCMNCNWSIGVRGYCPHQCATPVAGKMS